MPLQFLSSYTAASLGVSSLSGGMALVVQNGVAQLLYSEAQLNAAKSLSLGPVGAPGSGYVSRAALSEAAGTADSQQPGASLAFQDTGTGLRAFLFDSRLGQLTQAMLSGSGVPGPAQVVTTSVGALRGVQTFEIMGGAVGSVAVLSTWNKAGFSIYGLTGKGALDFAGAIADTAKSYVANVSDTATVTLGGQDYLLTLSSLENGLTCYVIGADRKAALIDSLGNHDGLWVSGPAALRTVAVDGVTYAVIAATGSSSLSVVRVNAMGCLFVTDHVVDDRTTRFAHPEVLDIFTLQGRSFVVSAGTDAGITMMELLPGGRLSAFSTVVLETGAGLAAVKGLEVALDGTQLKLFVVDARADRIQTFGMSLASLGGVVKAVAGLATGTAQDDLILGSAASEVLRGGAGDDRIVSGGGADTLAGGAGADVFVFDASTGSDRISDFELHLDRIDLGDWGNLASVSALKINATGTGCMLSYGAHQLSIVTANGQSLSAASFTDADFLF